MAPAVDDGADRIKVGITHGDFNGIGYEVILKALDDNRIFVALHPHNLWKCEDCGILPQGYGAAGLPAGSNPGSVASA